MERLDTYIHQNFNVTYTPSTLFMLIDMYRGTISSTYYNPLNIVREQWKQHTLYAQHNGYKDVASYLYAKAYELDYAPMQRMFENISNADTEQIQDADLMNIALAYLAQNSALSEHMLFGFVNIPEQRQMLINMFTGLRIKDPERICTYILQNTDVDAVLHTTAIFLTKTL